MTRLLRVVGHDPSLRNWGVSVGSYDLITGTLLIEGLILINAHLPTGKQVRQNSLDLMSAHQLYEKALEYSQGARAIFAEVPVGSQSARAMASYGVCVGVLGALRASGIPFFELTPTEVKVAACGKKTATKEDMINWATQKYPRAPWPKHRRNGEELVSEGQAEHLADATAAIEAGIKSQPFQQLVSMLRNPVY